MIHTATRNGITRPFSEQQWRSMPKDKFGWKETGEQPQVNTSTGKVKPNEVIQKKIVNGEVVTATKKEIPEELIPKVETDPITGNQEPVKPKRNVKRSAK